MSMAQVLAEDRRLIMLRALDEFGYSANETVLKSVTEKMGGHMPTSELIRADLAYMEQHGLISVERIGDGAQMWIAHLKTPGRDVARGRIYPGIARPEPG